MCGIAGIISTNRGNISKERLKKMTDAIIHRGPDAEGFWLNTNGNAGFGHRRLSIIDLSPHAAQPMHFGGRYSVIHNGEIYNYIELKETLQKKGYSFNTESDTEVILAAYDCFKEKCLQHFDGMFAFAIWDEKEQMLFCARDRFGEKPFYYSFDEDQFIFASEAKALWATGLKKEINDPLLLNYLVLGHMQTPVDKTITFFQEVFSLPPAHYLTFQLASFTFQLNNYWDCDKETKINISENEAAERLKELLVVSVKRRLRSDVAIGTSLSGGLDSSSIVAVVDEINTGNFNLKTFSAIFPGFEKDESGYINLVAKKFNLENYSITPTAGNFIKDFEKLCHHQEMPFSSASVFAQYKVFELAEQNNIKVLLDGQGADEVLAGYTKYIHWHLQQLTRASPFAARKEINALRKNKQAFQWSWKNYLAAWFPAQAANQLEKREARKLLKQPDITDDFKQQNFDRQTIYKPLVTKLNDILYFSTFQQGLEELLHYADRNSMAHSREVRMPFLNHELVQFIFSLPADFKIQNGFTKWILRKTMEHKLPAEIVWRANKVAFEPPQKEWMQSETMKEYVHEAKKVLIEEKILKPEVLNKKNQPLNAHAADNFDWRYLIAANCIRK